MQHRVADNERRKPGAAPIALRGDVGNLGRDNAVIARVLYSLPVVKQQVAKAGGPGYRVDSTRGDLVFNGVVVLQGTHRCGRFKISPCGDR